MLGKLNWFFFFNDAGAIDRKMSINGSVLEEKSFFKTLGLASSSKLDSTFMLSLLLKLPPRKLEP